MKRIGIPRAMYYYKFFPMWKTFFEELDAQIVVSEPTSKKTLDEGSKYCVDEACIAVKLYMGHVCNLKDKVDYIFIPRFTSISKKEYICPKFGGLPDMVRHSISNLPTIIDTEVNLYKSVNDVYLSAYDIGSFFSNDPIKISRAYKKSVQSLDSYNYKLRNGLFPDEIIENKITLIKKQYSNMLNIVVIGHDYNLYDKYFNMDLIKKLRKHNVNVITIEMIDKEIINKKASTLDKRMFWNFGRKAVGVALNAIDQRDVDGIIYLMSFGCGVDSFVSDFIERKIKNNSQMPFTLLTIDEHTGEAGLETRLEAFLDMIRWRDGHGSDISAHG